MKKKYIVVLSTIICIFLYCVSAHGSSYKLTNKSNPRKFFKSNITVVIDGVSMETYTDGDYDAYSHFPGYDYFYDPDLDAIHVASSTHGLYIYFMDLKKCGFDIQYDKKNNILKAQKIPNKTLSNNKIHTYKSNSTLKTYENDDLRTEFYKDNVIRIFLDGVELVDMENDRRFYYNTFYSNENGPLISVEWIELFYSNEFSYIYDDDNLYWDSENGYSYSSTYSMSLIYDTPICRINSTPCAKITEPLIEYAKRNWGDAIPNYFNNAVGLTRRQKIQYFNSFPLPCHVILGDINFCILDSFEKDYCKRLKNFTYYYKIKILDRYAVNHYDYNEKKENLNELFKDYETDYISVYKWLVEYNACKYRIEDNKFIVEPNSLNIIIRSAWGEDTYFEGTGDAVRRDTYLTAISCVDLKLYSDKKEIIPDDGMPSFLCIEDELYVKAKDLAKALNADFNNEYSAVLPKQKLHYR